MSKSNTHYMSELEKAHDMIEELTVALEKFPMPDLNHDIRSSEYGNRLFKWRNNICLQSIRKVRNP